MGADTAQMLSLLVQLTCAFWRNTRSALQQALGLDWFLKHTVATSALTSPVQELCVFAYRAARAKSLLMRRGENGKTEEGGLQYVVVQRRLLYLTRTHPPPVAVTAAASPEQQQRQQQQQ